MRPGEQHREAALDGQRGEPRLLLQFAGRGFDGVLAGIDHAGGKLHGSGCRRAEGGGQAKLPDDDDGVAGRIVGHDHGDRPGREIFPLHRSDARTAVEGIVFDRQLAEVAKAAVDQLLPQDLEAERLIGQLVAVVSAHSETIPVGAASMSKAAAINALV